MTRQSVFVNTRQNVPEAFNCRDILPAMRVGWLNRLIEAINADGRDYKAISLAARCGQNYVQQMIKEGKEPGTERFVRLLGALGRVPSLYVILGADLTPEDEELMALVATLSPEQKQAAIQFFRSQQGSSRRPKRQV